MLPTDPGQRIAFAHQKSVAKMFRRRGVRRCPCAVKHRQHSHPAAVGRLHQQRCVSRLRVFGADQHHIGRELHCAFRIARRKADIGDAAAPGQRRVDGEVGSAAYQFIGAAFAKRLPAQDVVPVRDLDPQQRGIRSNGKKKELGE